jgi:NAD-dependent dihydropyrimidine dehydrogenase PreA subunit
VIGSAQCAPKSGGFVAKVLALSSAFNSKGYHPPHVVAPEKCSGCDLCGMYCPDFAIYGQRLPAAKEANGTAAVPTKNGGAS